MAKKANKAAKAATGAATPRNMLAEAVNALNNGGMVFATEAEMAHLTGDPRGPLVEFNKTVTDPTDATKIAFRATALGKSVHETPAPVASPAAWGAPAPAMPAPAPAAAPAAPAGNSGGPKTYNFASGVPLPAPRRGGRGSTVYGFEAMHVGQSFFIGSTEDNPNPAKRIASTVSSASSRLEPKKFIVRSVTVDAAQSAAWNVPAGTKGAGIWRTV